MKEAILNKATELFLTHGFKTVTMDQLASEMGISKKTIYSHFSNKNDLVDASTNDLFDKISCGVDRICTLGKNPIEEIYEIKKYVMLHLKDEKSSPQYQLQKYYPNTFKVLQKRQFAMMQDCFLSNIKKGIAQGIYRENLVPEFILRIYYSGVNAIKDEDLFPPSITGIGALMDQYLEYHLRGIVSFKGLDILKETLSTHTKEK
jgi:AcrR family transcriptional regulator